MDFYSNLSSPLVLKPFTSGAAQGSSPPQPPWLSRPKEERPLLRPNSSGTPFNMGGPGSYPRRDSITRISLGANSNSESSMQSSSSSIDPYSSPITAEDLKNRYMRELSSNLSKGDDANVKLQEKTYMSTSPNPFLVNSFLKRQGGLLGQRPSSSSSIPNAVQASMQETRDEPKKSLVETGVLKPRRATTATSRFHSIDLNGSNSSLQSIQSKTSVSSSNSPGTNPMTMFSVMTKRPQRMVEHSTSVYANPQTRPVLANGKTSNLNFSSGKHYGSYNDISSGTMKENGDGTESHESVRERGDDFRVESMRMPVTGTMTSLTAYPRSARCEDLIYRPQSEKEFDESDSNSNLSVGNSESLYDRVKREVENHRKARQLAIEREKEMDERQKQIIQGKYTTAAIQKDKETEIKYKTTLETKSATSTITSPADGPLKQTVVKQKPPIAPMKETAPASLSSSAGSLQKAILPNRTLQQVKANIVEVRNKPERKTSIDRTQSYNSPKPRLNVTKRGSIIEHSIVKKEEICEDVSTDLGERQPGDGEAETLDDERTIRTEYSRGSTSRSSSVNADNTDRDIEDPTTDVDDDIDSDSSADSQSRPISRQSNSSSRTSRPSSVVSRRSQQSVVSDSDNDVSSDDDVTNMDSSSDDADGRSFSQSSVSSRRSRSATGVRRTKSRAKSSSSSDDDDDDDDEDDRRSTKSSTARRSRSVSRMSISTAGQDTKVISKEKTSQIKAGLTRVGTARKAKGLNPLIYSNFDNVPPCIRFVVDGDTVEQLPWKFRKYLIWRMSTLTPIVVKQTIWRSGFRASKLASVVDDVETHDTNDWIGYFGKHMRPNNFKCVREYQKYNHYPGSHQLGRKDRLWQNLFHMQRNISKKDYNFFPQTFCLPTDLKLLKKAWDEDGGHKMKWILKPPASARGQGIRVVHQWCQIPKKSSIIVQKYLSRPYLINESKFDLRVYVYVPSFDPLRIYIHEDGLVRFASQKYSNSVKNLGNRFMHLTNYSVNKQNTEYQSNSDDSQCQGHKWSLRALWSYMRRKGHNVDKIWEQIKDIIIKTIIAVEAHINAQVKLFCRRKYCVHELFGFDILLDESLQPWVLECNISPSLHSNSKLDINIKGEMIKDMFNIAGYQIPDKLESGAPSASYSPSSDMVCDRRLWYCEAGTDEKSKHNYFITRAEQGMSINSILDIITPEDLRILIESVDEFSRAGSFQTVFPTPNSRRYLKFFEKPRYSNLLLHSYVQRFSGKEKQGITWLNGMCQRKVHLQHGSKELRHKWRPTSGDKEKKTSSTSNMSSSTSTDVSSPFGNF